MSEILEADTAQRGCSLPTSVVQPQCMYDETFGGEMIVDLRL